MAKMSLPPGFRFHPTDVELLKYYLKRKVMGKKLCFEAIAEVDIYKYAPWDLPDKSCLRSRDLKWYFFCPREKKYANGARMNRATEFGYWKTTGKDRPVHYNNEAVGMIKTLVFHRGKAPRGERTDWVMHEYRIEEKVLADRGVVQDAYVLCIVFQKDGPGPRNGAQYGAPFKEEDWDDDEDVNCMEVVSSAILSIPVPNQVIPLAASSIVPEGQCFGPSQSCLSDSIPYAYKVLPPAPVDNDVPMGDALHTGEDDIASMLEFFIEDSAYVPTDNGQATNHDNEHNNDIVEATPSRAGVGIFDDLPDLGNLGAVRGDLHYDFIGSNNSAYDMNQMLVGDNEPYIELHDLDAPLNGPAEAGQYELNHTDGFFTDQSCYNSEQPIHLFNPLSSQSLPPMPPDWPPIAAEPQESGFYGNANEALLNHQGSSSHGSEEEQIRGGFNYPGTGSC